MSNLPLQLTQRETILCKLERLGRQPCSRTKGMWYSCLEIFNRQVKQRWGGGLAGSDIEGWKGLAMQGSVRERATGGNGGSLGWCLSPRAPSFSGSACVGVSGSSFSFVSSVFMWIFNWDRQPQWMVQCTRNCINLGSEERSEHRTGKMNKTVPMQAQDLNLHV